MSTDAVTPLRQRMIEDMNARKLCAGTQRGHIHSCKRFAAFLKRSPDTATAEDIRRFQLHLSETGASICNRNRIMTGLRFLFRVTLRRLDLAAEIFHLREPQRIPLVMSQDETRRLLAVAGSLKLRVLNVPKRELLRDLTRTKLVQQGGQGLSQLRAFPRHLGTHHHKEQHHQHKQQAVDHGDRPPAPVQQLFHATDQRAHQVGKKNGKQKRNQRGSRHVEKPQPQREQQHRDQSPRRS